MNNFEIAVNQVLKNEGGFVNNPQDKGGATNYGITQAVAQANGYQGDMRKLPINTAIEIYQKQYWIKSGCAPISIYSFNISFLLFDFAVNSGSLNAVKILQQSINKIDKNANLKIDGLFGQKTLNAFENLIGCLDILEKTYLCEIIRYYTKLNQFSTFGRGWINRVTNNIEFLIYKE